MRRKSTAALLWVLVSFGQIALAEDPLVLHDGWSIQSSSEVTDGGSVISTVTFVPQNWYAARVPSTVLAALVTGKVYPDPNFGMNLRSIPGTTYPIGTNFSNIRMPPGSAFRSSWWYRTRFTVPESYRGKHIQLHFDGINFRANVWLNGRQIADSRFMAGAWRLFDFDVTDTLHPGAPNALAVEIFPPTPDDLAITFVDWNPLPADKGMGIWRDVYLTATGPVAVKIPQAITALDLPSLETAHLTVTAELQNLTNNAVSGTLHGNIGEIEFSQPVTLQARQATVARFNPAQFQQLNISHPRLWWPVHTGPQNLYRLKLRFETDGAISDSREIRFGIRQITSEVQSAPGANGKPEYHRLFRINGKNILIRGAGYSFDMLLRESPEREQAELAYVRDLNLNAVRLEGKIVDENFLQLADEYGILITAGWCCCDHWEQWRRWDDEDRAVAAASLRDQIRRIRSHPSVFNWMNGSDNPPPPDVERMYIGILKEENWPNPYESSATARPTSVTGQTGVKMTGPYAYVPPSYWLEDKEYGGAHGFNTETGPGAAIPEIPSLREMLPPEHLWPVDSWWDYHAGGGVFRTLDLFNRVLNGRYGPAANLEDYDRKAQLIAYEGERAMFEAFGRNKYSATGVIQWMLNNAWPSMIWHLYDYYLRPGGGYFGTKKGCEPLHIQYSYDDRSVAVVNSYYDEFRGLHASAAVYDLSLKELFTKNAVLDILPDGTQRIFTVPIIPNLTATYFLQLMLHDQSGKLVSSNFYWLSNYPDVLDWAHTTWYYTPIKSYADFRDLRKLPQAELEATAQQSIIGEKAIAAIKLKNSSSSLAFFVHMKLTKGSHIAEDDEETHQSEILPVLWQDNYISIMPGEERELSAAYNLTGTRQQVTLEIDGWNIISEKLAIN